jgi:hypothetical protein
VAWSKVLTFTDPFQYTAAVRAADMQIFPTARGEFRAELTQVTMNELWMQRFNENLPRVHKRSSKAGSQGVQLSNRRSTRGAQPWQTIVDG